ncbi:MAG TPA: hypothetical protein VHH92_03380, partial [Actinomycetota bacterium]|nr:hypothetical protein [Actinomycetota bacterium]
MTRGTQRRPARWRSVAVITLGLMVGSVGTGIGIAAIGVTKKRADRKFLQNTTVVQQSFTVAGGTATAGQVSCPAGRQATGGGVDSPLVYNGSETLITFESRPIMAGARSVG